MIIWDGCKKGQSSPIKLNCPDARLNTLTLHCGFYPRNVSHVSTYILVKLAGLVNRKTEAW